MYALTHDTPRTARHSCDHNSAWGEQAPWSVDPAALLFRDKIGSLGIQSFLIQPVQRCVARVSPLTTSWADALHCAICSHFTRHLLVVRVPRYLLLLNALLKRTDPDHKDYNNIQKAAQQVFSHFFPQCACAVVSLFLVCNNR